MLQSLVPQSSSEHCGQTSCSHCSRVSVSFTFISDRHSLQTQQRLLCLSPPVYCWWLTWTVTCTMNRTACVSTWPQLLADVKCRKYIWALSAEAEELHPRYLWYWRETSTITFSDIWHHLGSKVLVLVTSLVAHILQQHNRIPEIQLEFLVLVCHPRVFSGPIWTPLKHLWGHHWIKTVTNFLVQLSKPGSSEYMMCLLFSFNWGLRVMNLVFLIEDYNFLSQHTVLFLCPLL